MKPIIVEVVTNLLSSYGHCTRCDLLFRESGVVFDVNKEDFGEYPEDLREESLRLSRWIRRLGELYRHRISVRLIDAKSLPGLYRSLIHRIRTYPTFIVEKKDLLSGWDSEGLEALIDAHIAQQKSA